MLFWKNKKGPYNLKEKRDAIVYILQMGCICHILHLLLPNPWGSTFGQNQCQIWIVLSPTRRKNLSRLKSLKILWIFERTRSHITKIIFGHFRVKNVILKKSIFSKKFQTFFKLCQKFFLQALEKYFFSNFLKVEKISFYPLFLSSKNIYKWLLKLNICDGPLLAKVGPNQLIPVTRKDFL